MCVIKMIHPCLDTLNDIIDVSILTYRFFGWKKIEPFSSSETTRNKNQWSVEQKDEFLLPARSLNAVPVIVPRVRRMGGGGVSFCRTSKKRWLPTKTKRVNWHVELSARIQMYHWWIVWQIRQHPVHCVMDGQSYLGSSYGQTERTSYHRLSHG